ncbi:serine hydrolase domain-containing protein [Weissella sp. GP1]|uniref:serine hydrolase domain-containing protein n=1 Tax=Weissella confusa TaxID=1583 RepID=UPI0032DB7AAE
MKHLKLGIGIVVIIIVALGAFISLNEPNKTAEEKAPVTKHAQANKIVPIKLRDVNKAVAPSGTLGAQIDQRVKESHHSGTLLVAQDGKIIINQGYGLANKSANTPTTAKSLYGIASIQKNLTAMLVMQQVAAGKIHLTDKVSQYLPDLPDADTVTVQQLLNMTAGYNQVGKTEDKLDEAGYVDFGLKHLTMDQRGAWYYSAGNYVALVGILREVTGKSYDQLLDKTFKKQFAIAYTNYNEFVNSPDRVENYGADGNPYFDNPSIFNREVGTGSIEMTTGNLYKLLHEELAGKLISKDLLQQMLVTGPNENYAAGLYDDGNAYRLHGVLLGFEPSVKTTKDGKTMVIWLSNENTAKTKENYTMVNQIFDTVTGTPITQ